MKVYIESLFLLNFMLDYMILYGTKRLLNIETTKKRIVLGALLGSITTFQVYWHLSSIELILLKGVLSVFMILLSFGRKEIQKNLFYFYMISILLGGSFYLLGIKGSFYQNAIFIILSSYFLIRVFIKEYKKYKSLQKEKYKVEITMEKKVYQLTGFLDTGNQLKSPISKKPVILVDLPITAKKSYFIPYKALNAEGMVECFRPDKLKINEKEIKECLIGKSNHKLQIEGCNCILPNCIKEEL